MWPLRTGVAYCLMAPLPPPSLVPCLCRVRGSQGAGTRHTANRRLPGRTRFPSPRFRFTIVRSSEKCDFSIIPPVSASKTPYFYSIFNCYCDQQFEAIITRLQKNLSVLAITWRSNDRKFSNTPKEQQCFTSSKLNINIFNFDRARYNFLKTTLTK